MGTMVPKILLKDLPLRLQSSLVKERVGILNGLIEALEQNDEANNIETAASEAVPSDMAAKALCKVLPMTLVRYTDELSRKTASRLVAVLASKHAEVVTKNLTASLQETFANWEQIYPTVSGAKTALAALNWTTIIVLNSTMAFEEAKKLVELEAILATVVFGAVSSTNRFYRKAKVLLSTAWSSAPSAFTKTFEGLDPHTNQTLVLGSHYVHWLSTDPKYDQEMKATKAGLLDSLVKRVIAGKARTADHIVQGLSPLLRLVTHDEFSRLLLPAIQKAMLRNPEIILPTLAFILASMAIDLSRYVGDLAKPFASQLLAKDDQTREFALATVASLARACSDQAAIADLLKAIFDVLNGSEGKVSVMAHKVTLLSAAGALAQNAVLATPTSQAALAGQAVRHLVSFCKTESHEGTLVHALDQMAVWLAKAGRHFPEELVAWLPQGVALKTATPAVKAAYLWCLQAGLLTSGGNNDGCLSLTGVLVKVLDTCSKQGSQVMVITEAAHAAACLIRLAPQEHGELVWSKTPLLTGAKFLGACGSQALQSLVYLAEQFLMVPQGLENQDMEQHWHRCLVAAATTDEDYQVRRLAGLTVKRLGNILGGHIILANLASQLALYLESLDDMDKPAVNAHHVLAAATFLAKASTDHPEDLALGLARPCHHPLVYPSNPHYWRCLVQKLGLDPVKCIEARAEALFETAIADIDRSGKLMIQELARIHPDRIVPMVVQKFMASLARDDLRVSNNEYAVYLTPKGEVYDRSVVDNLKDAQNDTKNIKRENKAYSYKEQMEEIALRKELEEKWRKEGKLQEPKLTPKQKEAFNAQLEKEDLIRDRLQAIRDAIGPYVNLVEAAVKGKPRAFAAFVADGQLLVALHRLLSCPLFIEQTAALLFDLRLAVFDGEEDSLAQAVVACTLHVVRDNGRDSRILANIVDRVQAACPFPNPAFHMCFKSIQAAMLQCKDSSTDEAQHVIAQGLAVLNEQADLVGSDEEETNLCNLDELHPKYLPRKEMLELLVTLLTSLTTSRLAQTAVTTLITVCRSASGKPGCTRAQNAEIQVLFDALRNDVECVRDAALRGLAALEDSLPSVGSDLYNDLVRRIWVARHDPVPENRILADQVWASAGLNFYNTLAHDLMSDVVYPGAACVRSAGARALSETPNLEAASLVSTLLTLYDDRLETSPQVLDNLGRVVQAPIDHWEPRDGIALALEYLAPHYHDPEMVQRVADFLVKEGLVDRKDQVRKRMLAAAVATVDHHGKTTAEDLLPVFEDFLDNAPADHRYDDARQSVVILMGNLAKHLDPSDPKVRPIMRQLILALNTPSQQVQEAVASCLPPLVPTIKEEAPEIVNNLISTLLGGQNIGYGERKGAAYGLAGLVKGLGILSLKQLDIMGQLTTAVTDKKHPAHREGALFAFEMLCLMLGRLFEPYIVHILPHLLLCFGDPVDHVREAADECAKAVMSKLSAHGVKLVLPSLLNALEEDQWRTKTGSVELLGAMAFCAPKQLSSCLPSIVPKLIEVLGDSHHKVQQAGAQALKQIGSVIRNPEIQAIVPILLKALQDPAKKTGECLQTLLDTKFVHFIDAPSLALIMPVVQRAFQDRSTETRKMAAQIIGNMYSLTDQKDLSPYLPGILPGLKASLLDPVPEVRTVSARALGAMVKGMGEASFEELLPWLMTTLTSESSSVDRSGAAQGLSEVVGGLGPDKMHELMPDIIRTAERSDIAPHVKDGYIMLFIFMPSVFPEEFTQYIGSIISPILRALADENEFVRDTAYKAGQRIVLAYADTAVLHLLPELERGLFDDNWRIRHSSVQLLGDLLYKISGVSGKMTTETAGEDDNFGTESSQKAVVRVLGPDRYHRVLAGLYMGRSDVALMVRQAALHVWKVVVSNTPKTLREVLPTLFNLLLGCLASNSYDKRQVAARTLGDLVKKLGERVLPEIIPILEDGLKSEMPEKRQGVCVGLSEIMASTSREMVLTFVDSLVPTVKRALCDDLHEVRVAAAKTFDSLHNTVGSRALDDILPAMLKQMTDNADAEDRQIYDNTLDGLRQVMAIKARAVLPYLVPHLIVAPVNTRALASLAPVAGEALHRHLPRILPALLSALANAQGKENAAQELEYAETVVLAVSDDESDIGVSCIMEELMSAASFKRDDNNRAKTDEKTLGVQRAAVTLLHSFCKDTKCDYSQYVAQLIRALILLFTASDPIILQQAWNALSAVTRTLDTSEQMAHVSDVRQAVRFAVMDLKQKEDLTSDDDASLLMPGFCLPKGITPILPIFRESILNGAPELKESAANGLGDVIRLTDAEALKPSVVHITGPLIRILGDRFGANVKTAVLDTLASLLQKAGVLLKPFFPQLQTTFVKALNDANRAVRLKAGVALSFLIDIHMRPDPLFNELHTGIKNADDASVRDTYLQALRGCLEPSGSKMSAPVRRQLLPQLIQLTGHVEDTSRVAAAGCLGTFCKWLPDEDMSSVLEDVLLLNVGGGSNDDSDWHVKHGRSAALYVALKDAPQRVCDSDGHRNRVVAAIKNLLASDRVALAQNGVRAAGYLFLYALANGQQLPPELITPFCKTMNHGSNDVKQLLAIVASYLSRKQTAEELLPAELLKPLLPMLVNGTKEKNSAVKASSESALCTVLHLRKNDGDQQKKKCLQILDSGARDALQDVINKVLVRVANQPQGKEEAIDDTVVTL